MTVGARAGPVDSRTGQGRAGREVEARPAQPLNRGSAGRGAYRGE